MLKGPGLRARKKLQVREELAAAAMKLFGKRGFDAVTVDEIVAAVDVSRRSFFRYFPTKEAVFFARRADQTQKMRALLDAPQPGERPFDTVQRALLTLGDQQLEQRAQVLTEHRIAAKTPHLLARDLEFDREATTAIALALARGAKSPARIHRARLAAGAMIGMLRVVIEDWVASGATSNLRKAGARAIALIRPLA